MSMIPHQVLGIDGGNYETKTVGEFGVDVFRSTIGEWEERTARETHSDQDMEWEFEGVKGFAGSLATVESQYSGSVYGTSKNHFDGRIRIMLAIHRNMKSQHLSIVVGQPYVSHNEDEKNDIIKSLKGPHTITVNGVRKDFMVDNVLVGIEGAMAFFSSPFSGPVNIVDVGSGTVNCIHFLDKRIVDRKSDTLPFGSETSKNGANFENMAQGVFRRMSGMWSKDDPTFVCGGSAKLVLPCLKRYYPLAELLPSKVTVNGGRHPVDPKFANAAGMFAAGVRSFANLQVN